MTRPEDLPKLGDDLTAQLHDWAEGDKKAGEQVMAALYEELRCMARRQMRKERETHTLQPTALVHEAYAKLVDLQRIRWQDRAHFLAAAAGTMRRILVDHARRHSSQKRDGGQRTPLEDLDLRMEPKPPEFLSVHLALEELAKIDERKARLVELRYFGGLEIEEAAEVLGCSRATVIRQWRLARVWLLKALGNPKEEPA